MGSVFLDLFIVYTIRLFLTTLINNKCILSARKFVEVLIESRYFLPHLFFSERKIQKQSFQISRKGNGFNILNKVKDKSRSNELVI